MNNLLIGVVGAIGAITIIGILRTKTPGFGKYTVSLLLIVLMIVVAALLVVGGLADPAVIRDLAFGVVGFAVGLVAGKDS